MFQVTVQVSNGTLFCDFGGCQVFFLNASPGRQQDFLVSQVTIQVQVSSDTFFDDFGGVQLFL